MLITDVIEKPIESRLTNQITHAKNKNGAGLLDRAIVYDSPAPIVAKLLDKGLSPNDARGVSVLFDDFENLARSTRK